VTLILCYSQRSPWHLPFINSFSIVAKHIDAQPVATAVIDISFASHPSLPRVCAVPSIHALAGDEYIGTFSGSWTDGGILSFVQQCQSPPPEPVMIDSMLQLLDFEQTEPVNIVVFSPPSSDFSRELCAAIGARARLLPIAFVTDRALAARLGISVTPSFVINRPLEFVRFHGQRYTRASLLPKLRPLITVIHSETLGDCAGAKWTLAVLLDYANVSHWREASEIFQHCAMVFGTKVAYQACDFFVCLQMSRLVGVRNVSEPVYIALKKSDEEIIERLYRGVRKSPTLLRTWLRDQMKISANEKMMMRGINVPAVPAAVFHAMVANHTPTVILFGNPDPEYYKALKQFVSVRRSGYFERVRFCRFNPIVQPMNGLPIKDGKIPRIGVYVAGEEVCTVDAECPYTATVPVIEQCLIDGMSK
jgi:hypothetical protein